MATQPAGDHMTWWERGRKRDGWSGVGGWQTLRGTMQTEIKGGCGGWPHGFVVVAEASRSVNQASAGPPPNMPLLSPEVHTPGPRWPSPQCQTPDGENLSPLSPHELALSSYEPTLQKGFLPTRSNLRSEPSQTRGRLDVPSGERLWFVFCIALSPHKWKRTLFKEKKKNTCLLKYI